jgi:hypothetical protein
MFQLKAHLQTNGGTLDSDYSSSKAARSASHALYCSSGLQPMFLIVWLCLW